MLANHIPRGEESKAFLQRALHLSVEINDKELVEIFTNAVYSEHHFDDITLDGEVASYSVKNLSRYNSSETNILPLRKGYEIAKLKPKFWQALLEKILSKTSSEDIVQQLSKSSMSVVEQEKEFTRVTKMSERSFYYHRKALVVENSPNKNAANELI